MSEVSTRVWLDEALWDELRRRAIREGVLVRDLIPRLPAQNAAGAGRTVAPGRPDDGGPPVAPMAEVYRCGACGAAVNQHINRHHKKAQTAAAVRS